PHLDPRCAPLAVVAEATSHHRALRRLAQRERHPRHVRERRHQSAYTRCYGAAVARADRFGKPHQLLAARLIVSPLLVVPFESGFAARPSHGRLTRGAAPTSARDANFEHLVERVRRVTREHVGKTGRETITQRDRHAPFSCERIESFEYRDR